MTVLNQIDRFTLSYDAIRRIPRLQHMVGQTKNWLDANLQRHKDYVMAHGEDLPEVRDWKWQA
jgi:xylulose-5-phosphate/fructose-6-phosphate phosphoketolase